MTMHATIIGGGRIGRGFAASLLERNQVEKNFFDMNEQVVQQFQEKETYKVHVLGHPEKDTTIHSFEGYSISDTDALAKELAKTDFVVTAVGGKNLVQLGETIGKSYKEALKNGEKPGFIILTCENWMTPADDLKSAILQQLSSEEQEIFSEKVDVTQGVIRASGTSAPAGEETSNPLDTWMQDYWVLPVDRKRITQNPIPDWDYFDFDDQFGEMLAQKIYTNNTSVALIAYLGYLKGHRYVADAANDPEIEPILKKCYEEINAALIETLGVSEESQLEFSRTAEEKYKDRTIVDEVTRIGRDPIRKLAPDDRLIGPAEMALEADVQPEAIAMGTAAALYFDYPQDPVSVELKKMREQQGIAYVLETICGLSKENPLTELIYQSIDTLKEKQWIKEGV